MSKWQKRQGPMSTYGEKLKDPRWQKRRLEILERDQWCCQSCFDSESTLHVHHRWYEKGKDPWDAPPEALLTLCEECHEHETTMWAQEGAYLLEQLKQHFLAADVNTLMCGFHKLRLLHQADVVASALEWFLETPEEQSALLERYFRHREARLQASPPEGDGG